MYDRLLVLQIPCLFLLHLHGNDASPHIAFHRHNCVSCIALLLRVRVEASHQDGREAQGATGSVKRRREVAGRQDGPPAVGDGEKSFKVRNERRARFDENPLGRLH